MTYSIGGQGVISGSRQFTGTDLELKNNNGDSKLIITGETGIAQIDTINEITADAGVTIESVELKDNTVTAHTIEATNYSVGSVNFVSATRQGNFRDLEVKSGSNVVTVLIDGDTGDISMNGRLDATDASFSEISTTGTAEFNGLSTFNNGLTVTSGSVTLPNSSIPSSAIIGGVGSNDFSAAVTMSDTLTVGGDASFNSNVYVAGDLSWNPASSIAANSIPASAIIGGVGSDDFSNAVTMSDKLTVSGDVSFNSGHFGVQGMRPGTTIMNGVNVNVDPTAQTWDTEGSTISATLAENSYPRSAISANGKYMLRRDGTDLKYREIILLRLVYRS